MAVILHLYAAIRQRVRELGSAEEADRGDNPVPTAIIIAGLAAMAIVVLTWALGVADGFMDISVPGLPSRP